MEDGGESGASEGLAPVIPLFGAAGAVVERGKRHTTPSITDDDLEPSWSSTWGADVHEVAVDEPTAAADEARRTELAEKTLLRKIRGRSLSVSEAHGVLAEFHLERHELDAIIEAFAGRGYLDDAALAEQIVHVGVDRRGSGRRVIAQTLAKRGIPRDVADAALSAVPDDDDERALEFARSKARGLGGLDHDTALRRLAGQLGRRGYPGSVALRAAKQALAEEGGPSPSVRFR
ncbi:regulatory protein RecX [Microbacterium ulmi]|uniref:regulatory protein RecX n=1 Tax=Microbacterium ulmi TaxID=179095 RepID=UPI00325BF627|nr:regulatory protein [Microbacterium ulmi]